MAAARDMYRLVAPSPAVSAACSVEASKSVCGREKDIMLEIMSESY